MRAAKTWATVWSLLRWAGAGAIIAAVVGQLILTVSIARDATTPYGSDVAVVITNFFSFFTILSNVGACVTLVIGGMLFFACGRREPVEPRWYATLLVCVTTYMLVTGVVYNTLLRNIPLPQGETLGWSNELLHVVMPIFLLLDLFLAPRRRALAFSAVWVVVVFPIVWVLYTLVRAPLVINPRTGDTGWWPYPFLNWTTVPGGGWGVLGYVIVIALVIVSIGFFGVWVGRRRVDRAVAPAPVGG